ncbi:AsmA family protein [Methylobacterium sp. Leaf108]|uniref:AsmA family protein n=1 Tax=Methylobacterium sp. Leaf108 TaxID=1736256 RepID=UPI0006FC2941|nr:AsmA family protein [Methylobacterium sp. Leaf108]KQP55168.1 AsmA protein [Methylobacterium sp. Leaf108]
MRDILTAVAGAVIVILVAALAIPPFFPWEEYRTLVDRAISRSVGLPARSEGRIGVRFLPSPRLRLDRLSLGDARDTDRPSVDLGFVKAEIGLTPLLSGEIRFTETRIGRAELRLPVTDGDSVMLPAAPLTGEDGLAVDDLAIRQLVVTTIATRTGRTDQIRAEDVRLDAPRLTGPWRVAGSRGGVPFRLSTGQPDAEGRIAVKLSGGGDTHPRVELDARLGLVPVPDAPAGPMRAMVPEAEGTWRVVVGPPTQAAGPYLPFSLSGRFASRGPVATLEGVTAEIDPGGKTLRLTGDGRLDLREGRAALRLEARRLDLDSFLISTEGQALIGRGMPAAAGNLPVLADLDVSVESLALGLDDWSDLDLGLTLDRDGGLVLRRFRTTAPGGARLTVTGSLDTQPRLRFTGTAGLDVAASDGFGRYLRKLGLEGPAVAVMDGRPIQASSDLSADFSAEAPTLSLRNLRLGLGEARITGNARYTRGEAGTRGRFDAQLAAKGVDIATLPSFAQAVSGLRGHDIGLTLQAGDVRYGPRQGAGGSIAASIRSDGPALSIDTLEVTDLAGANARLSGRIAPDGSGRIAGHVDAPVAAPLLALLDRAWVAEARLLPAFLRRGALDLDLSLEREAGAADTLRAAAKGKAAGSDLDLTVISRSGRIVSLDATLATAEAARWLGRGEAPTRQPARLTLTGRRGSLPGEPSPLSVTLDGAVAGLTLATKTPILVEPGLLPPDAGEIAIATADLGPVLDLAFGKGATVPGPLPADLVLGLSRAGDEARFAVSGRIAGHPVTASLLRAPEGDLGGSLGLRRLSLPWLVGVLALPPDPRAVPSADATLSGARFMPAPERPPLTLALRADTLDLGRGFTMTGAALNLRLADGALSLDDITGTLAGGVFTGSATVARQGGAASVSGEGRIDGADLKGLAGPGAVAATISASLRFGASGESFVGLANNLGGSGSLTLSGVSLPEGDPRGIGRALARALEDDDPLREGRLKGWMAEALAAGPFAARGPARVPATLVGGALRATPLSLDLDGGRWDGKIDLDLRSGRFEARGTLTGTDAPRGWTAGPPAIQFGYAGSLAKPERIVDPGPLTTGLAAVVLQRELESIELFEADQSERQRRRARIEMDRARAEAIKAAAERMAADKVAADKMAADKAATERAAAEKAAAERLAAERAAKAAADRAAAEARSREPPTPPVPAEP